MEMEKGFALHPRLAADTVGIGPSVLSAVRLVNDSRYPWLILVPRRANMHEFIELQDNEQSLLLEEIRRCCELFKALHKPARINIAMIGNLVPQLHVHVVARFRKDAAWPRPVWGVGEAVPYTKEAGNACVTRYKQFLGV
jgi:diadenosine tetraphosphate (Ap4A) HIT family hydrolase